MGRGRRDHARRRTPVDARPRHRGPRTARGPADPEVNVGQGVLGLPRSNVARSSPATTSATPRSRTRATPTPSRGRPASARSSRPARHRRHRGRRPRRALEPCAAFDAEHVALVGAFGDIAAAAIGNARLIEALHRSEVRYRYLLAHRRTSCSRWTPEGRFTFLSDTAGASAGLVGRPRWSGRHFGDADRRVVPWATRRDRWRALREHPGRRPRRPVPPRPSRRAADPVRDHAPFGLEDDGRFTGRARRRARRLRAASAWSASCGARPWSSPPARSVPTSLGSCTTPSRRRSSA